MFHKHLIVIAGFFILGLAQAEASAGFSEESLQSLAQALQKTCWEITRSANGDIVLKPWSKQNAGAGQASSWNRGSRSPNTASDMSALEKALESAGWKTQRQDNGDLLLFPQGDAPPLIDAADETPVQASPAPDIQDSVIDFETLPQRLRAAGWIVEEDQDGSLTIHWPEPTRQAASTTANDASMDTLKRTLEQSGWVVKKTSDGDLLLFPQASGGSASAVAGGRSAAEAGGKTSPAPLEMDAVTDLDQLQQRLESVGWITSRDKNGDLVVYWSESAGSDGDGQTQHSTGDLEQLIPLLENTGWRVKKSDSGDLLLYPRQAAGDSATGVDVKPAVGPAPADRDADGVADENDLCPNSASGAQVDSTGCAVNSLVLEGVTFKYSSSRLTPEAKVFLKKQAARMRQYPGLRFRITGHTDSRGSASKNQKLSEKRARSVFLYLIKQGVNEDSMVYSGAGETRPIASNATEEGRRKNRRVELHIIPPAK